MVDNPLAPLYGSDLAVNLAEIAVLNFGMLDRTGRGVACPFPIIVQAIQRLRRASSAF
jgi:hypothetical protein